MSDEGGAPAPLQPDSRRRGREAAFQMLYQWEVGRVSMPLVRQDFWMVGEPETAAATERIQQFAEALAEGTVDALARIDALIEERAQNWRLARMPVVDRLILRLATYELLHAPETPPAVVIDEALELAHRFSTPEAIPFINGVLDGIRRGLADEGTKPR